MAILNNRRTTFRAIGANATKTIKVCTDNLSVAIRAYVAKPQKRIIYKMETSRMLQQNNSK